MISISSSFKVSNNLPIDDRLAFEDLVQANALPIERRYLGMIVFINNSKSYYALTNDVNTFEEISLGSSAGISMSEWTSGSDYFVNNYVSYGGRIFQAKVDTSNADFDYSEWTTLSGSIYCETLAKRPTVGTIGVLYLVESDSTKADATTLYIWDSGLNDYSLVSGGSEDSADTKQILISNVDTTEGFLESKIVGTTDKVIVTKNNIGLNEQLQINISNNILDKTVNTTDDITEGSTNKFYKSNTTKDEIGAILTDTTTVDMTYNSTTKTIKADVLPNTHIQKSEFGKNGIVKATRKQINLIEGSNTTIVMADDSTNDKVDVTITSTAEINTASNVGTSGVGIFKTKDIYDLQLKKIDSHDNKLLITDDIVNGVVKLQIDDSKLSISGSQISDLSSSIANDGNMVGLIAKSHEHTNTTVLNGLTDVGGHLNYNGDDLGDVIMSSIDSNLDGIVDKASTLDGMTVGVTEVNYLQGASSNIQTQINALSKGIHYGGSVTTKAVLLAKTTMTDGELVIVLTDEEHSNGRSQYIYNETTLTWEYNGTFDSTSRDFAINPLSLVTEVTGILPESKVDALLARKTELPIILNKAVLDKISDVSGVLNYNSNPIFNSSMVIDDAVTVSTKTWSSSKLYNSLGQVGVKMVNEAGRGNNKLLVYNQLSDKMVYTRMFAPDWEQIVEYTKGDLVWYNDGMYRCSTPHTSGITLEASIDNWKSVGGGGTSGVSQLKEITGQTTIAGNDSIYMHLSVGFNKYDIRTLYAKSLQDNNIIVEIYNATNGGFTVYESLEQSEIHDTLMTPCSDGDSTKCIHIKIFNKGTTQTDVKYLLYVTSLS